MGSLLVRATFGEMEAGRFALQSGQRSSEKGFQTTFGVGGKGSSLEKPRVCVEALMRATLATHGFQVLRDL